MLKQNYLLFFGLLSLLLLFSCAGKKPLPEKIAPKEVPLSQRANSAWESKHYFKSERLYSKLLAKEELAAQERSLAWKRLAISAVKNRHFDLALDALQEWANLSPQAERTWLWQENYLQTLLKTKGEQLYLAHIDNLLAAAQYPWPIKRQSAWQLTFYYLQNDKYKQALKVQRQVYKIAPDQSSRAALENQFREELQKISSADWTQLASLLPDQDTSLFPYSLLAWEQAMRKLQKDKSSWPEVWQAFQRVINKATLANLEPLQEKLRKLQDELGVPLRKIALLVPLSGKFKDIGWQVARGAGMAQWQRARNGERLHVQLINTASEDWLQQLQKLPLEYRLVGGPLRLSIWEDILHNKAEEKRAFFTFLSTLGAAEEGKQAWRFFSSPRDQIKALLNLTAQQMGIENFAILYPDERYGLHMAELFWQEAVQQGAQLRGLESYPPQEPTKWGNVISGFLNAEERKEFKVENIDLNSTDFNATNEPDFKAVFIPDSLSRAQLLVPEFFFYDEDRLIFLGPELWSQALCNEQSVEQNYFQLAVMPGAWWPDNPAPELEKLERELDAAGLQRPSFWTALGYDFLRFACQLGSLPPEFDSEKINQRLHQSDFSSWTLAPLFWDPNGGARQELFLFQPRTDELIRAESQEILELRKKIRRQHAQRIKRRLLQEKKEAEAKAAATRAKHEKKEKQSEAKP
jgi:hypothetical protein